MKQFLKPPVYWLSLLALVTSFTATAQLGEVYYGPTTSSSTVNHGVGTGVQAFSIFTGGSYDGFTYGIGVDNFIGPNGAAGAQEIGGIIAPIFDTLNLNNGATSVFNITNTAGILVNGGLAYNNGITSTLRTNRTVGLAAAIQFLGTAVYTPALTPAIGTDVVFTDGFVSKVNPAAFVYPVGNVTDLRPITATGTGTFATAWSNVNVATPYPYTPSTLPIGTKTLNTNGYWEWSGTAAATATLSIPDETAFTTANKLSVMAYNGTAWKNIGGTFTTNTENSTNTAVVTVPATTQALALGQTVDYVTVKTKAFLQGATNSGVMSNLLNTLNIIPLTQPYTSAPFGSAGNGYSGTESVAVGFFSTHTNIVDWILVELRDSVNAASILATRAAFLTTSGAIVDLDGTSDVSFLGAVAGTSNGIPSKGYYIAIRHRNHLGIRTATTQALSTTGTLYDFSLATTQANGTNSMKNLGNGVFAMWAGNVEYTANASSKQVINYGGSVSDAARIQAFLTTAVGNTLHVTTFTGASMTGIYNNYDVNLDGNIRYGGTASVSDVVLVQSNVTNFPSNTLHTTTYTGLVENF